MEKLNKQEFKKAYRLFEEQGHPYPEMAASRLYSESKKEGTEKGRIGTYKVPAQWAGRQGIKAGDIRTLEDEVALATAYDSELFDHPKVNGDETRLFAASRFGLKTVPKTGTIKGKGKAYVENIRRFDVKGAIDSTINGGKRVASGTGVTVGKTGSGVEEVTGIDDAFSSARDEAEGTIRQIADQEGASPEQADLMLQSFTAPISMEILNRDNDLDNLLLDLFEKV